jgi:transposase
LEKYSEQTKLDAVEAYRSGQLGLNATAKQMNVGVSSLRKWVAGYQANGVAGVQGKRRELYNLEFKLAVLQRARDENLSNRQAAALFNIRNFNIIAAWERAYEADGMAGLDSRRAGRRKSSTEAAPVPLPQLGDDDDTRSREDLLDELNSLRAENAYLKKVEALVRSQTTSAQSKGRKS